MNTDQSPPDSVEVACFGGLNRDRCGIAKAGVIAGSSNPVTMRESAGGVAANVARALAALGRRPTLVARVGADGTALIGRDSDLIAPLLIVDPDRPTASYTTLVQPDGRLFVGIADMDVHENWSHADLDRALAHAAAAQTWFVDANLPEAAIARLCTMATGARVVAANGVSARKAVRLMGCLDRITVLFANAEEAVVLGLDPLAPMRGADLVTVVTHGAQGLRVAVGNAVTMLPAPALSGPATDETGAGDCLIAGTLAGRLRGLDWSAALGLGQQAAALAMTSPDAVPQQALKALALAPVTG